MNLMMHLVSKYRRIGSQGYSQGKYSFNKWLLFPEIINSWNSLIVLHARLMTISGQFLIQSMIIHVLTYICVCFLYYRLCTYPGTRCKWRPSRRTPSRAPARAPTASCGPPTRPAPWPGSGSPWPSSASASGSSWVCSIGRKRYLENFLTALLYSEHRTGTKFIIPHNSRSANLCKTFDVF